MEADRKTIKRRLSEAGLSDPLIEAAWPAWWSDDAFPSESARAELRFSLARKLGLSPTSLIQDEVQFVWTDQARFKHLSNETDVEKSALTSFGVSVCRILVQSLTSPDAPVKVGALELRAAILHARQFIDLQALLAVCWSIGIPVIHLRVFPLQAKRMHAMAVNIAGRPAILLGRDAHFPAAIAFTLAHEIGHIMLGHVSDASPVVDVGDPWSQAEGDDEEVAADRFALELLLGTAQPEIQSNKNTFNARQLAVAVLEQAPALRIEPGTLALCVAHRRNMWPVANKALQLIYVQQKPVWREINQVAETQIHWSELNEDSSAYLKKIMGMPDG